ncbi:hypothetical protein PC123_g5331 [Phytophthora cactorum]|nr:hypothetical protein PC123_g5331 [Phytophthora cactorum]
MEDLLPRPSIHHQVVQLVNKLETLDSVCVKLQSEERTLADVRLLFDTDMAKYPATSHHLSASARIIHSPVFESAVVKLMSDRALTAEEEESVARFAATDTRPHDEWTLRLKLYPTSNRCERLFSQCKLVLSPFRSSLLPASFEMLVFLRANRELWNFTTLLGYDDTDAQVAE